MLAVARLPTDAEAPPVIGLRILAQRLGVVDRHLHIAPQIGVFAALHHHAVDPAQAPVIVAELEIGHALRNGQKVGDDRGLRFAHGLLLRLESGRIAKRLPGQNHRLRIRPFDRRDGLVKQRLDQRVLLRRRATAEMPFAPGADVVVVVRAQLFHLRGDAGGDKLSHGRLPRIHPRKGQPAPLVGHGRDLNAGPLCVAVPEFFRLHAVVIRHRPRLI